MPIGSICLMLIALLACGTAHAAGESTVQIRAAKPGSTVIVDRVINESKVLVSVVDAAQNPLTGLTAKDFSVKLAGNTAKILSVTPIAESQEVPRHIVLVLDNSYSMQERRAVKALLAGVDELLKIVRPIDDVQMVLFDNKNKVTMGGRELRVQTFTSNQPAEMKAFAAKAYKEGITASTYLYEAMLGGLDLLGRMPTTEPRFMVVFSDGEDLNSAFKRDDVLAAAKGIAPFNAYAIDYMERRATDKFLTAFTKQNRGQIWKASSETNLVPIFQSVATKMQHYYIVSYLFAPTGTLTAAPAVLTVDQVATLAAAPVERLDVSTLTLKPVITSAYGIARWKANVSNASGSVADLAGEGAPAAEIKIPMPAGDLQKLAAGGDLAVKMELQDTQGQDLVLNAPAVKVRMVRTSAGLTVTPANVTIEEIKTIDASPMLGHVYFAKGSSEIPSQYVRFAGPADTAGFDEQKFRETLEKYYQVLNIVGSRLKANPAATVTLVGCNDNTGSEKGKKKLSGQRAEAVKNYLQSIWGIAPERMVVEARNLPAMQSSATLKEGQAENRRVEIRSAVPLILAPIRSTYLSTRIDAPELTLRPVVTAPYGIAAWKVTAGNAVGSLADLAGKGTPAKEMKIDLAKKDLRALATAGDISVKMELQDKKGQNMMVSPAPVKVTFIQTSQRAAQKEGETVQEKYALILFDFNKETLGAANQQLIDRIVGRIKTLPQVSIEIVGHTDSIGKEAYNMKLSERRAQAVYKQLTAAYGENAGDRIRASGVGPNSPLFDNLTPEGRSFNRTVTITLEYMSPE